jgi:hypothetical protein
MATALREKRFLSVRSISALKQGALEVDSPGRFLGHKFRMADNPEVRRITQYKRADREQSKSADGLRGEWQHRVSGEGCQLDASRGARINPDHLFDFGTGTDRTYEFHAI